MLGKSWDWTFGVLRNGSTKSLLIFGRNLREGIPTQTTAEFPHRGRLRYPFRIFLQEFLSLRLRFFFSVPILSSGRLSASFLVLILSGSYGLSRVLTSFFLLTSFPLAITLSYPYQVLSFYSIVILSYHLNLYP